jgi:hypothetical protein
MPAETKAAPLSPCHHATILLGLGDGVLVGSCSICNADVFRANPRTGRREWLDGESTGTEREDLRPMKSDGYARSRRI